MENKSLVKNLWPENSIKLNNIISEFNNNIQDKHFNKPEGFHNNFINDLTNYIKDRCVGHIYNSSLKDETTNEEIKGDYGEVSAMFGIRNESIINNILKNKDNNLKIHPNGSQNFPDMIYKNYAFDYKAVHCNSLKLKPGFYTGNPNNDFGSIYEIVKSQKKFLEGNYTSKDFGGSYIIYTFYTELENGKAKILDIKIIPTPLVIKFVIKPKSNNKNNSRESRNNNIIGNFYIHMEKSKTGWPKNYENLDEFLNKLQQAVKNFNY